MMVELNVGRIKSWTSLQLANELHKPIFRKFSMDNILGANLAYMQLISRDTLHLTSN